ncbi:inositol monophosphatase family protein [Neobacillus sp. OS1-32]|uniref:inositol monophosphatase family protein n=1 Tax=Neobacillus sp. OS1-32 TaxID=3070682 RepID=UPI0027E15C62|nr:inositol monophosphatase family protein [Neobacillus sp. OS1-32]WML31943.1 inositol monophosphatase family protein [Neobacillus sp. OS1-32]
MNWEEVYTSAKQWVIEAGEIIRASFKRTLTIRTKSNPNDLVTDIDQQIEQFFISKIRERYPEHKIMGEEGFADRIEQLDGIVWLIDPIDGTMNFIHQQRNFAISIGIYEHGIGKVGIIYDVVHDELYHAVRGNGAYLNDQPLQPLKERAVKESIIALNATWVMENHRINHQLLIPLVRDARGTRSYGSAALELVYVATGRVDAYLSMRLSPWDVAAGAVLVEELGGVVTNLKGEKLDFVSRNSLFAAKPGLHQVILEKYLKKGNW